MKKKCFMFCILLCIFNIFSSICYGSESPDYSVEEMDGNYILTIPREIYEKKGSYLLQVLDQDLPAPEQSSVDNVFPEPVTLDLKDGEYSIELSMTGGSGKAAIVSPALLTVREGKAYVRLQWSSSNYDYMLVGTEKYLNENAEGGNSEFEIPITVLDNDMNVVADTTAMGTPHEINYTLTFYSDSIGSKSQMPQEAAKKVVAIALAIIIGGGILNHYVNKKRRV
ncbi:MAG: hypothetical protein Q4F83_05215 [Eubacteriales bacterium]|nr:hypothetical protein [Eubacteriales bacterium]